MKNALIVIACALVVITGIGALAISRAADRAASFDTERVSELAEIVQDGGGSPLGVSEAQGLAFAERWADAMVSGDSAAVLELSDIQAFHARAFGDLPMDRGWTRALEDTFTEVFTGIAEGTAKEVSAGGDYAFVHLLRRGDARHALFRLDTDDGFNYHDLRLTQGPDGTVTDQLFIAITGEEIADHIRTQVMPALIADASLGSKLSGKAKKEARWLADQAALSEAFRAGDHAKVCEEFDRLDPEVQERRFPAFMNLNASVWVDEGRFMEALERYRARFPADPAVEFFSIDAAVIREDDEALVRSGEAISRWTGNDPWLATFIAAARSTIGSVEEANESLNRLGTRDFGSANAMFSALDVSLAAGDHVATAAYLAVLRDRYDTTFTLERLDEVPGFDAFRTTPEFEAHFGSGD